MRQLVVLAAVAAVAAVAACGSGSDPRSVPFRGVEMTMDGAGHEWADAFATRTTGGGFVADVEREHGLEIELRVDAARAGGTFECNGEAVYVALIERRDAADRAIWRTSDGTCKIVLDVFGSHDGARIAGRFTGVVSRTTEDGTVKRMTITYGAFELVSRSPDAGDGGDAPKLEKLTRH